MHLCLKEDGEMHFRNNHMKKIKILLQSLIMCFCVAAQNTNVSEGDVFDGEPYVAVNPNDADHIVIAWMGWVNIIQRFKIKSKVSFDGGINWSETVELPHTVDGYSSADPCIAFNSEGEVYISYIDFTGTEPPVTGGVYICKSTDGGLTFAPPMEVINTDFDGEKWPIDRPWMVIDKSGLESDGRIFVTTFNLNRLQPSYNPYLSVSNDDGTTFSSQRADAEGFLAGSLNPFPLCSPVVNSEGTFFGVYPSYVLSQSLFFKSLMVSSSNGGVDLGHKDVQIQNNPPSIQDYPNAKKGSLLKSDPSDPGHLAFMYLGAENDNLDVFLIESFDAGDSWTDPVKVNDDPIENDRMQDMVWGDFDLDGDLIVVWRDRRNGDSNTFQSSSEIWAALKLKNEEAFSENFVLSSESVAYDDVLESAGNDFMCVDLHDDIINATWGDTRDGKLNIWFQRMNLEGVVMNLIDLAQTSTIKVNAFPNPTSSVIKITSDRIQKVSVFDVTGMIMNQYSLNNLDEFTINLKNFTSGNYLIQVKTATGIRTLPVVKK